MIVFQKNAETLVNAHKRLLCRVTAAWSCWSQGTSCFIGLVLSFSVWIFIDITLMCFFLSLVYCRLNRASLLIKAPSPLLHLSCSREEQRMRGGEEAFVWTDGPRRCCCFSPPLIFDLPNAFEWPSSRQHRHLTPVRGMTMTHRHRGGTSCPSVIRYNLFPLGRSIFVLRTFFHWFCYELWTSSGQCPSTP